MSEFFLPPELFTEEEEETLIKTQNKTHYRGKDPVFDDLTFDLNSEYESESEDEEDYLDGLIGKMENSKLNDDDDSWKTEAGMKCLCGCKEGLGNGSRIFPEEARKAAEWEFLYAAAREIMRKRKIEEANEYYQAMGVNPVSQPVESNRNSYEQLQIAKFQQMKREHWMKQEEALEEQAMTEQAMEEQVMAEKAMEERAMREQKMAEVAARMGIPKPSWPTQQNSLHLPHQQPQASSGMRAVILGNAGSKLREPAGTGVFLPRSADGVTEPLKKSGSSTVLLPDRVVQAVNLNLEAMDSQSCLNNALNSDFDAASYMRSNIPMGVQNKQNLRPNVPMGVQHKQNFRPNVPMGVQHKQNLRPNFPMGVLHKPKLWPNVPMCVQYNQNLQPNVPMGMQHKQNLRPTSAMAYTDLQLPQEWTY